MNLKEYLLKIVPIIIIIFLFSSCYSFLEKELPPPEKALIPVNYFYPDFTDDLDRDSMIRALQQNMEYFQKKGPDYRLQYGPDFFTGQQVMDTQRYFVELLQTIDDRAELNRRIRQDFKVYRAAGRGWPRRVLFTGYYEPVYEGNLSPDQTYQYPVYRRPEDLIRIDLSLFHKKYENQSIMARMEGQSVRPYFTRHQIDVERALAGRGLELAWLKNPLDPIFLQIQGSGRIRLPDGKTILAGYHASNGWPYRSIGRYMLDKGLLSKERMSMQGIRHYLSNNPDRMQEVLSHNPSYVFFRQLEDGPFGNIGVLLTPGRSLALDNRLFPRGALCFVLAQKPVLDEKDEIMEWIDFSRFMVHQDTGGAIKGPGRADIFWGSGSYAEVAAGHMQHEGKLYILIKKP